MKEDKVEYAKRFARLSELEDENIAETINELDEMELKYLYAWIKKYESEHKPNENK